MSRYTMASLAAENVDPAGGFSCPSEQSEASPRTERNQGMEFSRESEMLEPVRLWLESSGLKTKAEYVTPWGISDLVGCRLNRRKLAQRMALGQRSPIGPPLRIALLTEIPDVETGEAIHLDQLTDLYHGWLDGTTVSKEINRLVSGHFVQMTGSGSFQKVNGWMPLHSKIVTVELKLERTAEALRQATANQQLTSESYVALPLIVAKKLLVSRQKINLHHAGIGLLGVTKSQCRVLLKPVAAPSHQIDRVTQIHCGERFFRDFLKGS